MSHADHNQKQPAIARATLDEGHNLMSADRQKETLFAASIVAGLTTVVFLLWMIVVIGGPRLTDGVDDVGELIAALVATVACFVAAAHVPSRRSRWVLLGVSSFAWAMGETV